MKHAYLLLILLTLSTSVLAQIHVQYDLEENHTANQDQLYKASKSWAESLGGEKVIKYSECNQIVIEVRHVIKSGKAKGLLKYRMTILIYEAQSRCIFDEFNHSRFGNITAERKVDGVKKKSWWAAQRVSGSEANKLHRDLMKLLNDIPNS